MDMELKIKCVREGAVLPKYATGGAAGMDLSACIKEPITIAPGEMIKIPCGIAVLLPKATTGLVFARSGLAVKHGISLSNGVGVIDSDYTGEIHVGLHNISESTYTIEPGERIAQLVVVPVLAAKIIEVESLDETARGSGGFGSTGRHV